MLSIRSITSESKMLTDNQLKQIEDKLFDAISRVDSKKPNEWEALAKLTDALVSIQTIQTTREIFEDEEEVERPVIPVWYHDK